MCKCRMFVVAAPVHVTFRIAWSGGNMTTNKLDAVQKFIEKKGGVHGLNEQQRKLLGIISTSHEKVSAEVRIVPTAALVHGAAAGAKGAPVHKRKSIDRPGAGASAASHGPTVTFSDDGNPAPVKRQLVARQGTGVAMPVSAAPAPGAETSHRPPLFVGSKKQAVSATATPAVRASAPPPPAALTVVVSNPSATATHRSPLAVKGPKGRAGAAFAGRAKPAGAKGGPKPGNNKSPSVPAVHAALSLSAKLSMPLEKLVKSKA
jgi:hypothetical protein